MNFEDFIQIVCVCGAIYIVLAPIGAIWIGRKLRDISKFYPPVEKDEDDR